MELKEGMVLHVRKDLKVGDEIGGFIVRDWIKDIEGKSVEIERILSDGYILCKDYLFVLRPNLFEEFNDWILKTVKEHKKWITSDHYFGKRAYFEDMDLRGVCFDKADLRWAFFNRVDLRGACLNEVDLRESLFQEIDLGGVYLKQVEMENLCVPRSNFERTYFCECNMRNMYFGKTCLSNARLMKYDLEDGCMNFSIMEDIEIIKSNITNLDLYGSVLTNARLNRNIGEPYYGTNTAFYALQCPEEGSFIGFKSAIYEEDPVIVKLLIPVHAKRSSATTRKCRCSDAKVISIESLDGKVKYESACSRRDSSFIYEVGKEVSVSDFDKNRWNECSTGIHFFITRQEAVNFTK